MFQGKSGGFRGVATRLKIRLEPVQVQFSPKKHDPAQVSFEIFFGGESDLM